MDYLIQSQLLFLNTLDQILHEFLYLQFLLFQLLQLLLENGLNLCTTQNDNKCLDHVFCFHTAPHFEIRLLFVPHIHKQLDDKVIDFDEFEERKIDLMSRLPID